MAHLNVIRPQDYVRADLPNDIETTRRLMLFTVGYGVINCFIVGGMCLCIMVEDVSGG